MWVVLWLWGCGASLTRNRCGCSPLGPKGRVPWAKWLPQLKLARSLALEKHTVHLSLHCTTIHSPAMPCHPPCKCNLASVFYLSTQTEAHLAFVHLLNGCLGRPK